MNTANKKVRFTDVVMRPFSIQLGIIFLCMIYIYLNDQRAISVQNNYFVKLDQVIVDPYLQMGLKKEENGE